MIDLVKELKDIKSVGISGHIRPDGDCVGSTMAVYLYIKKNMPEIDAHIYLESPPPVFACIKDIDKVEDPKAGKDIVFDAFIMIDTVKDRAGDAETLYDKAKKRINIDHHITNPGTDSDVSFIVPSASSAAELVFECFDESLMDIEIAKAVYIGMVHDTGVFQYSNVSPKTLNYAAKLIGYGFDFSTIIAETFYEKTYLQSQILGRVLSESILVMDGRVSVGHIDQKMAKFYNSHPFDYDGIVNALKQIKGVDVAIFMHELPDHKYKVSLRSTDRIDVSEVCSYFGGGGHKKAAGVIMEGNFYDVVNNLTARIEKQYAERTDQRI